VNLPVFVRRYRTLGLIDGLGHLDSARANPRAVEMVFARPYAVIVVKSIHPTGQAQIAVVKYEARRVDERRGPANSRRVSATTGQAE